MQLLLKIPKLEIETIRIFLVEKNLVDGTAQRKQTRNPASQAYENIIVDDIFFTKGKNRNGQTLFATVSEITRTRRKTNELRHSIELKFCGANVESVVCKKCDGAKVRCNAISSFMYWIQHKQVETLYDQENVVPEENEPKKSKMKEECFVVVERLLVPNSAPQIPAAAVLSKLKREPVPITPLELDRAQKLSMFALVREYQGSNPDEFLQFCSERMAQQNCSSIELLTVEQADTDLWHELRKGRITASRMHEASRCTMLNGSLTNKIMGVSSGFSFAMKRGTDLEGHVFAELQKEFPSLRNTGLVLDPRFPWMGASPDGLCDEFVLEIKCPYTPKTYDCYVDVNKLSKKYLAQIQLQMHMTHKTKALLGVAALDFETTKNVTKVWIDYDKAYVDQIKTEAYEFWCKAVFKALLKKRNSKK